MAKAQKPIPPPSSSEEDSSSDDEQQPTTTMKPVVPQTQTHEETESESASESESGEDEDEEEPEPVTRPVNNVREKPRPSSPSKPASDGESESESIDGESESESGDSQAPKLVTPINSRPMATVAASPKDSNAGKHLFQRIWTLEDEISVLKGMAQFQSERGPIKHTVAGTEDFHAFIKESLSLEVSKNQLMDKIRRLKSKYLAAAARAKSGQPHKFQKPHDESIYELGKKIWVSDDENKGRPSAESDGSARSLKRDFLFLKEAAAEIMGSRFAMEKLVRIDPGKAEVLEKGLKKPKLAEMKHYVREMDLCKETIKLIMEGVERAKS